MNLFEIGHSLGRQFGPEQWTLYKGRHLFNFADNHDVTRIATILQEKRHLPPLYGLLFAMPGIPCVYYGSEWGAEGDKAAGDDALRPAFERPQWNAPCDHIAALSRARAQSAALRQGDFRVLQLTNRQFVFARACEGERVIVAVNADDAPYVAHFDAGAGRATDLITGGAHDFGGGSELAPYGVYYWKCE